MKICKKCNIEKPESEFRRHSTYKDGLSTSCKACTKIQQSKIYHPPADIEFKVCSMCKEKVPIKYFAKYKRASDGYVAYCSFCKYQYQKEKGYPQKYQHNRKIRYRTDEEYRQMISEQKRRDRIKHKARQMFKGAKQRAKRYGLDFNIEESDIIIPEYCPILKAKLINGTKDDYEFSPSLDRIDPKKGYTKGNIQVISKKANSMKNNATKEELIQFATYILNNVDMI